MNRKACGVMAVAVLGAHTASGAAKSHLHTDTDPATHVERLWVELPTRVCEGSHGKFKPGAEVRLVVNAFVGPDGRKDYVLSVDIADDHLMHAGANTKMVTTVGQRVDTLGLADVKDKWSEWDVVTGERRVRLVLPFGVNREYVEGLAVAPELQFQVESRRDKFERCARGSDLRAVGELLQAVDAR